MVCFNQKPKFCWIVASFQYPIPCRPFLYILVQISKSSHITYTFCRKNKHIEKSLSHAHYYETKNKTKPSNTLCYVSIEYIFQIRYWIKTQNNQLLTLIVPKQHQVFCKCILKSNSKELLESVILHHFFC